MVAPINYDTGAPDPSSIIANGYQMGLVSGQRKQDAALKEAQVNKINQEAMRRQKMQEDLSALQNNANPTAADYTRIISSYPEVAEPMKKAWEVMDAGQQKQNISMAAQALSAVKSGNPEIAQQLFTDQANALRKSGKEQEAKASETWAKLIELHPEMAVNTANIALASVMDPKEFASTYDKINSSDANAAKARAEAMTATVTAQNAPLAQSLDMEKIKADIASSQAGAANSRLANQIKMLELQQSRETNALKKEELGLKLQDAKMKQSDAVNEKVSSYKTAISTIDNTLSQISLLKNHPGKNSATGVIDSKLPTLKQDTADFEELAKTLDAQVFLAQIPAMKGMGALSEKEGDKLQSSFQSLGLRQSTAQFDRNLGEVERLLMKARENASEKYGMPNTAPDVPKPKEGAATDTTQLFKDADAILGLP